MAGKILCNIVVVERSGYPDTPNYTKVSPVPSHPALWIDRVPDIYEYKLTRCSLALEYMYPHGSPIEGPETQILNRHLDRHKE